MTLRRSEMNMRTVKTYYIAYRDGDVVKNLEILARTAREALALFLEDEGDYEVLRVIEWISGRVQVENKVENNEII